MDVKRVVDKMNELCIFNNNKKCNQCGECDKCDLYPGKKCNNCGKCLEIEGYDIRAIKIEEVFEKKDDISEYEELDKLHWESNETILEDDEAWTYIDDIKDLQELLNEEDKEDLLEEFPGLILYKKRRGEEEM